MLANDQPSLAAYASASDEELVPHVLRGQPLLFAALMRRHNPRIYRVVRAVLSDEAEVEDVMQTAYLQAYTQLATFRGDARFSTWLSRIAVNEALARVRRGRRQPTISLSVVEEPAMPPADETTSPESHASRREMAGLLERAVDSLPEMYRSTFMLREIEGCSTAETAQILSVSEDVVKTRMVRARAELRDRLEELVVGGAALAFGFHASRCDRVVAAVMLAIAA